MNHERLQYSVRHREYHNLYCRLSQLVESRLAKIYFARYLHWARALVYCLSCMAFSEIAHAWVDPSGYIIGQTYNGVLAAYPKVIASNMSHATYQAHVAHSHSVVYGAGTTSDFCTRPYIAYTGRGTREVSPFEGGWICTVGRVWYDEFVTSPSCNGPKITTSKLQSHCALVQTMAEFSKQANPNRVKQMAPAPLTPIGVIGQWVLIYNLSKWSIEALEEMLRMCVNTPGCDQTQGPQDQDCNENPTCLTGTAYDMQLIDDYYNADNQPNGNPLTEWYDLQYVGDFELSLSNMWGAVIEGNVYDASLDGFGGWGLMSEEYYGGDIVCTEGLSSCP